MIPIIPKLYYFSLCNDIRKRIPLIHKNPYLGVIITSGGGYGVFGELSRNGGTSNTLLEGKILHCTESTDEFLCHDSKKYCSMENAYELAEGAYGLSQNYRPELTDLFGISCTAKLSTGKADEREGREHLVFISFVSNRYNFNRKYNLTGLNLTRDYEELLCTGLIIQCLCDGLNIECEYDMIPESIKESI